MKFAWRLGKQILAQIFHSLRATIDILLFLLSLKVFPLAWHVRNYYSYILRYKLNNRPIPLATPPAITIFQPTIWTSNTPLGEIDIMGHKSNSTYFTDFDVARNYHICSLFRTGLKVWGDRWSFINPQTHKARGTKVFFVALAGVGFKFHRAIRPGQEYEICTRVLSWDDKWLHLVSHFVEKGACNPAYFSDQQQKQHDLETNSKGLGNLQTVHCETDSQSVVFATGIAKIVFKKGRRTIPPSQFLSDCGLLPQSARDVMHESNCRGAAKCEDTILAKMEEMIEERRAKGHRIAKHINGLDDGRSIYSAHEKVFFSKA